ncbi:MAG TPA: hypothetical protein DIT19_03430 [Desulfonauticus sp.]|nr:MAG: hypothetical protein XD41_0003 [Desulfonauticus sp. 38_4375]HCO12261.1 hypothetical protein [Desulfonauticus sp.]
MSRKTIFILLLVLVSGFIFLFTFKFKKEPVKQVEGIKSKVSSKIDKNTTYGYEFSSLKPEVSENNTEEVVEEEKKEEQVTDLPPTFPQVSFFQVELVDRVIDFFLKNYDSQRDNFTFSLKKMNLYFGVDLEGFTAEGEDVQQKRLFIFKQLFSTSFSQEIFPLLKSFVLYRLNDKLDSYVKENNWPEAKRKLFLTSLQEKILAIARELNLMGSKTELVTGIKDYLEIQKSLYQIYAKYWQLEEKDKEEKARLGDLIKKTIFAREHLQKKILAQLKDVGLSAEDKLYLGLWTYRRMEKDGFTSVEILRLASMLEDLAKSLLKA